ncbi:MAG: glycosyltransferase family 4 protein [Alistipes sp.]|nr:glycosyltransferase family 4 protein [Alistipes sp.]
MKRSYIVGFDAKHANRGNTKQSSYARFVIDALSNACPKSAYFRMYIEKSEPHSEYEALAERSNVESMEPDGLLWRKLSWLWRMWHIGHDLERGDVELYHALAGLVPYGLAHRNIRTVVTVHSLEFLRLRRLFSPIYNFYRRAIMLSSMHRADRIVAVSECVKHDLVRYLHIDADKIDVIYGGCHHRFSKPVSEAEMERVRERYNLPNRYLLVAGRHNARKNLNHIIETLPQMEKDVEIVIVGRGTEQTANLVRRIKALGIEERVRLLYGVADEDMPAIYRGATAYLMLSLYEGFSTTIVEALTVGVPVIAARGSSLEEVGGPSSIYVDSDDREALSVAIRRVVESEELRNKMVAEGREYANRFRPEVIAYNLLNCYRRIGIDIPM